MATPRAAGWDQSERSTANAKCRKDLPAAHPKDDIVSEPFRPAQKYWVFAYSAFAREPVPTRHYPNASDCTSAPENGAAAH